MRGVIEQRLDVLVPISHQPRELVSQIIADASSKFPEFSSCVRKRIRTFLKSYRRSRKVRETPNGMGASSPRSQVYHTCRSDPPTNITLYSPSLPPSLPNRNLLLSLLLLQLLPWHLLRRPRSLPILQYCSVWCDCMCVIRCWKRQLFFPAPHPLHPLLVPTFTSLTPRGSSWTQQLTLSHTHFHPPLPHSQGQRSLQSGSSYLVTTSSSQFRAISLRLLGYRESAGFLQRAADQLEAMLASKENST